MAIFNSYVKLPEGIKPEAHVHIHHIHIEDVIKVQDKSPSTLDQMFFGSIFRSQKTIGIE